MISILSQFKCFNCGQLDHKSSDCPKRKFTQANFIEQKDDENEDAEGNEEMTGGEELGFLNAEVSGNEEHFFMIHRAMILPKTPTNDNWLRRNIFHHMHSGGTLFINDL